MSQKQLVLLDFDGTITVKDVTNMIIDHYTGTWWRDEVLPRFWRGEIDHLQVMVEIYAPLTIPEPKLIEFSLQKTQIRPGYEQLYNFCKERNADVIILSGGMDFYIKPFLLPGMRYFSYTGGLENGGWKVVRPDFPPMQVGDDFKVRVMEELVAVGNYSEVIFCGDGRNDFPLAQKVDQLFAVEGSRLSQLCTDAHVPHTTFTDFFQVIQKMEAKG